MPVKGKPAESSNVVRIKDVALAAGVSTATVSQVFNHKGEVAKATRARVLATGKRLGYTPNPVGRALRTGQSRVLGVLVSYRDSPVWQETYLPYYREIISDAAIEAMEHGYSVAAASPGADDLADAISNLGGVIVVDPVADDAIVGYCAARGIPLVADGGLFGVRGEKQMVVRGDVARFVGEILELSAAQHRARHGRELTDIGLFTGSVIDRYTADSEEAFVAWCDARRVTPHVFALKPGETVKGKALQILKENDLDAAYCLNESYSGALIGAADALGIDIPGQLILSSAVTAPHSRQDPRINYVESAEAEGPGRRAVRLLVDFLETGTAKDSVEGFRLRPAR